MQLKSAKTQKILFESNSRTIKRAVEEAVLSGTDLSHIDLRRANLIGAQIDGAHMPGARFWGANLTLVNMAGGDYSGADFRTAVLKETCLAEASCQGSDFSGAYFNGTIITEVDLTHTRFSCPSVFSLDFPSVRCLEGAIYSHLGEMDCPLSQVPLIVLGKGQKLVGLDQHVLIGSRLYGVDILQKHHPDIADAMEKLRRVQL